MPSPFQTQFTTPFPSANDGILERVAKLEARVLSGEQLPLQLTGQFLSLTGGTLSGNLTVNGILTVRDFAEIGGVFVHFGDSLFNTAPVGLQLYHETLVGTPAVGNGVSFDFQMDSDTVKRQVGARWVNSWTDATAQTAQLRLFLPNAGTLSLALTVSPTTLGFYGVAPVARPSVPDGSTLATLIDALQALGLVAP